MKLIALKPIRHAAGTIPVDGSFEADADFAQHTISKGLAVPETQRANIPWQGHGYWRVQPEWRGQTVVIVGGGPSLTKEQVDAAGHVVVGRAAPKVIAINNAIELAPWADVLYFCDARWYEWHRDRVRTSSCNASWTCAVCETTAPRVSRQQAMA
jgi:hypothetical protein